MHGAILLMTIIPTAAILRGSTNSSASSNNCVNDVIAGSLAVDGVGTVYIAQEGGTDGMLQIDGDALTVPFGAARAYFASSCVSAFSSGMYKQMKLLDHELTFDADISSVACGCNAALYGVAMPSSDAGSSGSYYCDSGANSDPDCAEMDIMESNNHAFVVTPHQCSASYCDYGGDGKHAFDEVGADAYGYGSSHTIDTSQTFTVSMAFHSNGAGALGRIVTTWSQGGREVTMTNDDADYLVNLRDDDLNMVLTISHWATEDAGGMAWMDSPPCNGGEMCDGRGSATFSNFALKSISDDRRRLQL